MAEGGGRIALAQLQGKNEDLLLHTLQLIQYLLTVTQNVNSFIELAIVDKIISLVQGSGIVGVFFPDKLLLIICQIARMLIEAVEETKTTFLHHLDLFYNLCISARKNYQPSEALILEVFNFCLKLIAGDLAAKRKFGELFLEMIVDKVKSRKITISDLKSRTLSLLLIVIKEVEGISHKIRKDSDFISVIHEWSQDFKDKGSMLLSLLDSNEGKEEDSKEKEKDKKKKKK